MKKILCLIIFLFPLKVWAGINDTTIGMQPMGSSIFYYKAYGPGSAVIRAGTYKIINGYIPGFCLESGINIFNVPYSSNGVLTTPNINITDSELKVMEDYATFGYEYPGQQTLNYYLATQELIWRAHPTFTDFKWLYANNPIYQYSVEYEKNKIINNINEFNILPNLSATIDGLIGDHVVLNDTNNVLHNYQVVDNPSNVQINNNQLIVDIVQKNQKIELIRKSPTPLKSVFYTAPYSQTIGKIYTNRSMIKEMNINGTHQGMISFINVDEFGDPILDNQLELLDDQNNVIDTFRSNGEYNRLLSEGNYTIRQIDVTDKYLLNSNQIEFSIDETNFNNIKLSMVNNFIRKNIKVKIFNQKYNFKSNEYFFIESNDETISIFKDKKLIESLTTQNGSATSSDLIIDNFEIIQNQLSDVYQKEKYQIDLNLHDDIVIYNYLKTGKLNTNYFDGIKLTPILNIHYGLFQNDKLLTQLHENVLLPLGNYQIKELIPISGYQQDNYVYYASFTEHGQIINLNVTKTPDIKLPQTDQHNYFHFLWLGLLCIYAIKKMANY